MPVLLMALCTFPALYLQASNNVLFALDDVQWDVKKK